MSSQPPGQSYWSQHPPERTEPRRGSLLLIVGLILFVFVGLPVLSIMALLFFGTEISTILSRWATDLSPPPMSPAP
jgi:hypothetical protein